MDRFIRRQNIELFQKRLSEANTEEQRRVILKLLAEEEAKDGTVRGNSQGAGSAGKSKDAR
jgi:hypothetical protein